MKTYPAPAPFVPSPNDVKGCKKCGQPLIELRSFKNGAIYFTEIRNGLTARNWFHTCATKQPGLFQKQLSVTGILQLFTTAAQHLKFPKIWLQTKSGQPVMVYRAGVRSKYNGQLIITNGEKFGAFTYKRYGRIDQQGVLHEEPGITDEITSLLEQLSKDPAGVAAAYGKLTGNCCFCYKKLTDDRSTGVGYGPVCADHFGLPWGARPAPVQKSYPNNLRGLGSPSEERTLDADAEADAKEFEKDMGTFVDTYEKKVLGNSNWTLVEGNGERLRYTAEISDFGPDRRDLSCPDCQQPLMGQSTLVKKDGEGDIQSYEITCACGTQVTLFND